MHRSIGLAARCALDMGVKGCLGCSPILVSLDDVSSTITRTWTWDLLTAHTAAERTQCLPLTLPAKPVQLDGGGVSGLFVASEEVSVSVSTRRTERHNHHPPQANVAWRIAVIRGGIRGTAQKLAWAH